MTRNITRLLRLQILLELYNQTYLLHVTHTNTYCAVCIGKSGVLQTHCQKERCGLERSTYILYLLHNNNNLTTTDRRTISIREETFIPNLWGLSIESSLFSSARSHSPDDPDFYVNYITWICLVKKGFRGNLAHEKDEHEESRQHITMVRNIRHYLQS